MCSRNKNNMVVMTTLNQETQKQVAVFNQAETCSILPFIDDGDFLQWLYQEAVAGRWDQNLVFGALAKEDVNGKTVVVTRRKKGTKSIIIQHNKTNCSNPFPQIQLWKSAALGLLGKNVRG